MKSRTRLMAIGAVSVALILGVQSLTRALRSLAVWKEHVRVSTALLVRQERELTELPRLEQHADSMKVKIAALARQLVPGRTEPEAQAELLAQVQAVALGTIGILQRTEVLPDSVGVGWLRRVRARALWSSDLPGLLTFVHRLEYGSWLLVVRRLRVESISVDPSGQSQEQLSTELVLEGWYLSREGE